MTQPHWYCDPVSWSVILTALSTVVYVFITYRLWKSTERTADIAERTANITQRIFEAQNRPYVGVYQVNYDRGNPTCVHIEIRIKNAGTVIASGIMLEVDCLHNGVSF